jgi:O-antigen ligase
LTGRTNGWSTLLDVLPKTSWLAGNGYRTSDEDFDFSVDSGYLASAYEMGIFSTVVILAKYILVLAGLAGAYLSRHRPGSALPFLIFTLAVFFANGFVHRVLFGYGDPASLFTLFCFVSTRKDANHAAAGC